MAEFLWTFAVQEVLKKTVNLAAKQIRLAWGFKNDLSKLRDSLFMVEAILRDVDRIKAEHQAVKLWVEKLQDIVFQADVFLDELAYEDLRRKVETETMVSNFVSPSKNPFVFRLKMANKIKAITKMLQNHYASASAVGLVAITSSKENELDLRQIQETDSFLDDIGFIGREQEVSEIVKKVIELSNRETLSVLPIVGMGGLGKTALTKVIFNHEMIKGNFDRTIWVCVSEPFLINKILRAILETLNPQLGGLESKEALLQEIQKSLHDQRYFLVLDDVWNENVSLWNELKACLLKITQRFGNVVVVTSRSDEVANIMETHPRHHLKKLSNDDCWSLFEKCAFAGNDLPTDPKVDKIRKALVENFGGIPLVVKVLGGTVKLDENYERLQSRLENLMRIPSRDENRVLSTIKLSVDRLPSSSLKQCFAYCSNFPQDYEFRRETLVQMWIAQGFIQASEESDVMMEDVGDKYFNILLSRSLFQDVVKDKRGIVIYCKMHDFIHNIACAISIGYGTRKLDSSYSNGARISHMLAFDSHVFHNKLTDFIYLRVLIARSWLIWELPSSIAKLKHLRYVDIEHSSIRELPESFGLLYNLQTLRLGRCTKVLPKNLSRLISLRHLKFYNDPSNQMKQMPQHLSRLSQLQTLPSFIVRFQEGYMIEELGPLKNLKGKLSLLCLEQVNSKKEAMAAKLMEKGNILYLDFQWSWKDEREVSSYNDLEVLEGLQPHKNLQTLRIQNFAGEHLPGRVFVEKLVEIYLHDCERCETLPMLGQLSELEILEIRNLPSVRRIGGEFYGNYWRKRTLFPKLKTFHIFEMKSLEHWEEIETIPNGTIFPHLESLSIICCLKLMSIPNFFASCSKRLEVDNVNVSAKLQSLKILGCEKLTKLTDGIEFCCSLEKVWISNCSSLNSFPSMQNMHRLSVLDIRDFQKLPNALASLVNLKDLTIHGDFQVYDWSPLVHLGSLENLELFNSRSCATQLLRQLEHLMQFDGVEALPEWFENFMSLKTLKLYNRRNLKNMSSQEAMSNLAKLHRLHLRVYGFSQLGLGNGDFELVKTSHGSIHFVPQFFFLVALEGREVNLHSKRIPINQMILSCNATEWILDVCHLPRVLHSCIHNVSLRLSHVTLFLGLLTETSGTYSFSKMNSEC